MKNEEIDIRLVAVREVASRTHINRWSLMRHDGSEVNISLHAAYSRNGPTNLVLTLEAKYTTTRALMRRTLLTYAMEMIFDVDYLNLISDKEDGELLLPRELLLTTMNAGIGTLRGMLAAATSSTFLANYPLPLMSISSLISNMEDAPDNARGRFPEITITN